MKVITNEGIILKKKHYIDSYLLDQNRKGEGKDIEKEITLVKYYHLIPNKVEIYERKYNTLFDAFSDIGEVVQLIYYFFYWLNYVYNKYIILIDTNNLLFNTDNKSNIILNLKKNKSYITKKSKIISQLKDKNNFSKSHKNLDLKLNNDIK